MRRMLFALLLLPAHALAEEGVCKIVELDFQPAQITTTVPHRRWQGVATSCASRPPTRAG